ncbi:hypothetical protein D3C72_1740900 [compost metagenome]
MLGQQDRRDDFRADGAVQRLRFQVRQQRIGAADVGGGADQMVYLARFLEQPPHLVFARHVGRQQARLAELAQPLARRLELLWRPPNDQDLRPHAHQARAERQPHARTAAHHHDLLTFELLVHAHYLLEESAWWRGASAGASRNA